MKCDIHVYSLIFCAEFNKLTFKHLQYPYHGLNEFHYMNISTTYMMNNPRSLFNLSTSSIEMIWYNMKVLPLDSSVDVWKSFNKFQHKKLGCKHVHDIIWTSSPDTWWGSPCPCWTCPPAPWCWFCRCWELFYWIQPSKHVHYNMPHYIMLILNYSIYMTYPS